MKRSLLIALALTVSFMLTACGGNSYDDEIDSVIELENEELEKASVETDVDTLERNDLEEANVFNDGEYIELIYVTRGNSDTSSPVYKYDEDVSEYVRYNNGDFYADEIDDLEADYTENNED